MNVILRLLLATLFAVGTLGYATTYADNAASNTAETTTEQSTATALSLLTDPEIDAGEDEEPDCE